MNLSQLYYFRKLAEIEHYGKASKELFITQPSLSNAIGNLERELGVQLFERVGRNVRLTSYGAEFNKHICRALSEVDKAVNLMKLYSSGLIGEIHIGTVISIQRTFLPQLLNGFRESFGDGIVFDIHQGTTYECVRGLRDGKLDIAFCGRLPNEPDLVFTPMLTQNLVIGVHTSHPLAERETVSMRELVNYDVVSYRSESYVHQRLDGLFAKWGVAAKEGFNDEISAMSLVMAEKSVVALMLNTFDDVFGDGLVNIPIEELSEPYHAIYLVHKGNVARNSAAEQLIEYATGTAEWDGSTPVLEDDM